ncbi:hypothetical protein D3C72_1938110 [compost metagenome]
MQGSADGQQGGAVADQCWKTATLVDRGKWQVIAVALALHCRQQVGQLQRQRELILAGPQQCPPGGRRAAQARGQHGQPRQVMVLLDPRQQQLRRLCIQMAKIDDGDQMIAAAQANGHGGRRADTAQLPSGGRQRAAFGGRWLAEPDHAARWNLLACRHAFPQHPGNAGG